MHVAYCGNYHVLHIHLLAGCFESVGQSKNIPGGKDVIRKHALIFASSRTTGPLV